MADRTLTPEAIRAAQLDDVRACFGGEAGARLLDRLALKFYQAPGTDSTLHDGADGHVDPYRTVYREGQRTVVRYLQLELARARGLVESSVPRTAETGVKG